MSYINIPPTKEQIWVTFSSLCSEKEAATKPGEPLPPVFLRLKKAPTEEEKMWYLSQRLPGRYAERYIDYDTANQELTVPIVVVPH